MDISCIIISSNLFSFKFDSNHFKQAAHYTGWAKINQTQPSNEYMNCKIILFYILYFIRNIPCKFNVHRSQFPTKYYYYYYYCVLLH